MCAEKVNANPSSLIKLFKVSRNNFSSNSISAKINFLPLSQFFLPMRISQTNLLISASCKPAILEILCPLLFNKLIFKRIAICASE